MKNKKTQVSFQKKLNSITHIDLLVNPANIVLPIRDMKNSFLKRMQTKHFIKIGQAASEEFGFKLRHENFLY